MKPFEIIENQKKVIEDLTFELKYSKNKSKDTKRINTLIKTVNAFDKLMTRKYKTDALESLIYALIYELLMFYRAYEKEIPLPEIIKTIDDCFLYGSYYKKNECISILKTHELNNKINEGIDSVFDGDYANFDKMLNNLINEFKQQAVWKS